MTPFDQLLMSFKMIVVSQKKDSKQDEALFIKVKMLLDTNICAL